MEISLEAVIIVCPIISIMCFNPCFDGDQSGRGGKAGNWIKILSFNPCFDGDQSGRTYLRATLGCKYRFQSLF